LWTAHLAWPVWSVLALCLVGAGCAGRNVTRAHGPGGTIHLAGRLPAPTPSPFGLHGNTPRSQPLGQRQAPELALDAYLKPEFRQQEVELRPTSREPAKLATSAASTPTLPAVSSDTAASARALGPSGAPVASDAQRYAEREQNAERQRRFSGGDAIVIGTGTLIVVLLVAILVLLIT
jgi:hypothetical protein